MKKRAPGTGTVQFQNGRWRIKLPRSLDPSHKWLKETFARDEEDLAHAFADACISEARKLRDQQTIHDGLTFGLVWPRYVERITRTAARRHGTHSATKTRSRLDSMGNRWLSKAPFWRVEVSLIRGTEIRQWLEHVQLTATNARGEPISDSWVDQCAGAIRGVFHMLHMTVPVFSVETEYQRVQSALNPHQLRRFFALMEDPRDRVLAGCQLGAGLRVGEILSLRVENVHIGNDPHILVENGGPHGAPTKSRRPRRVELFDPGLGFFKMALRHYHVPNTKGLLFAGPSGGYLGGWTENFTAWSELFGEHITSHGLRHSYAYGMLSGLWGYPPQDLTFVSRQMGHQSVQTTQKAYGHWDPSSGLTTARSLRGETTSNGPVLTAEWLLGEGTTTCGPECGPPRQETAGFSANWVSDGNSSPAPVFPAEVEKVDHGVVRETARALTKALLDGETGLPQARDFLKSLGDDPRALRALVRVLEGDRTGVRQAADLMVDLFAEAPRTAKAPSLRRVK